MKTRRMRLLREKHSIPLLELSRYADVSQQRLAQIELGEEAVTDSKNRLVEMAFVRLITARRRELAVLEADFQTHRKRLLEFVEEKEERT